MKNRKQWDKKMLNVLRSQTVKQLVMADDF